LGLLIDSDAAKAGGSPAACKKTAASTKPVTISLVIPVYNEEKRIVNTITLLSAYLERQGQSYEIVISDDGSRDDGPLLIKEGFAGNEQVRLIQEKQNRGKGAAVRRGVLAARGEFIIFTDADLSYPVETIGLCLEALQEYDIAIGSRNLPDSDIDITPPLIRRLAGPVFKAAVRRLVLPGFTDTQCGFKGFRSYAARDIFSNCKVNGFAFDVEVLALARKFGYSITELPVRLLVDSSDSHINLTSDPFLMVMDLLKIRARLNRLEKEIE
jgi:dolichyl-phosphate beta-glucosyltransferase